ncbi:MAG: DUF120 domain-containing protein [Acidimicrobiia bacterium]|nr:DUF120 domain-containing protein [Acidimicrobiia bacterium]
MEGGCGIGAELMTDPVVLGRIQTAVDQEIVPSTLNVGIPDPLNRKLLSSYLPGGEIDPKWEADTGQAGYFWSPTLVAGSHRGVVVQADEPDYPQTPIEVLCEVRLRSALGLSDGDGITVSLPED